MVRQVKVDLDKEEVLEPREEEKPRKKESLYSDFLGNDEDDFIDYNGFL